MSKAKLGVTRGKAKQMTLTALKGVCAAGGTVLFLYCMYKSGAKLFAFAFEKVSTVMLDQIT